MTTAAQKRARKKFVKMAKLRAKKLRAARIKKLEAELRKLRKRRH